MSESGTLSSTAVVRLHFELSCDLRTALISADPRYRALSGCFTICEGVSKRSTVAIRGSYESGPGGLHSLVAPKRH